MRSYWYEEYVGIHTIGSYKALEQYHADPLSLVDSHPDLTLCVARPF